MNTLRLVGLSKKRLRLGLLLFFLALAIPAAFLIVHAYDQLKWEAFHQNQVLAEELSQRIDDTYQRLINHEEARPFTDYAFLNIAGDPQAGFLQRSPLSAFPADSDIPGLVGYFQIDGHGIPTTPLLPVAGDEATLYGIDAAEQYERLALQEKIITILSHNRLVATDDKAERQRRQLAEIGADEEKRATYLLEDREMSAPAVEAEATMEQLAAQSAFDQLSAGSVPDGTEAKKKSLSKLGRVEELQLESNYQQRQKISEPLRKDEADLANARSVRKEQNILPAPALAPLEQRTHIAGSVDEGSGLDRQLRITTFESEIDPFEISLLDSGHFVLYRKAWRNGERTIQGMLIEQKPFITGIVQRAFNDTALAQMSELIVAYRGDVLNLYSGTGNRYALNSSAALEGELLYQSPLSSPLNELELIYSITRLPAGPGAHVILWNAAILALVLLTGVYLIYRLALGQLNLARQQQDFVSAVSHELKTPLTSIRMYSEMLREGWGDEAKKHHYYDYIHDESERLSRLINNVLLLARMTRSEMPINRREIPVSELIALIRTKITSLCEGQGFELQIQCDEMSGRKMLNIDPDHFTQIIINLVDNAIKFSVRQERKRIEIGCAAQSDNTILFSVRDYGPGIARDQMKKIFRLFYRTENELTRETIGTGIGLALVHQLTRSMDGTIDVLNREPGAEFRIYFPAIEANNRGNSS